MQQVPRGRYKFLSQVLIVRAVAAAIGRGSREKKTERKRKERRKRYRGEGKKGEEPGGRVNAKYETGEVSAWNVTSLENVSRVQFSETRSTRERPCLNDYKVHRRNGKRDSYRRNRASWNNEAIGGIRERRDHGNRECGLSNAGP